MSSAPYGGVVSDTPPTMLHFIPLILPIFMFGMVVEAIIWPYICDFLKIED